MKNRLVRQAKLPKGAFDKSLEEATAPYRRGVWCGIHPTGFWGKNPLTGLYYKQCAKGHKLGQDCEFRED